MDSPLRGIPIVDAHQHFWNPLVNHHPWLCDHPPIPFRYGDYSSLVRPYLPRDYLHDAGSFAVAGTVYVEAEWDPGAAVPELEWVACVRRDSGYPTVAVAQAWLDRPDIEPATGAAAGLRLRARHPAQAALESRAAQEGRARRHERRSLPQRLRRARAAGLALRPADPVVAPARSGGAGGRFPAGPGHHQPRGAAGGSQCARPGRLAGRAGPRGAVPRHGAEDLGTRRAGQAWTAEANRAIVLDAIEIFGSDRCLFASNFPVDSLCASFDQIFHGFATIVQDFSESERRALFHDNAVRLYAITDLQAPC